MGSNSPLGQAPAGGPPCILALNRAWHIINPAGGNGTWGQDKGARVASGSRGSAGRLPSRAGRGRIGSCLGTQQACHTRAKFPELGSRLLATICHRGGSGAEGVDPKARLASSAVLVLYSAWVPGHFSGAFSEPRTHLAKTITWTKITFRALSFPPGTLGL